MTVLGELLDDLAMALRSMDMRVKPDGWWEISGAMPADGPLVRALLRAEAELLNGDADDMAARRWTERTPAQRRADAFVLVTERLTATIDEWLGQRSGSDELT
jgi:hypothetical protein